MPHPYARIKLFLSWQNSFCPGQNSFCPRQEKFPKLEKYILLVKWMEYNILAMENNFSTA